jgi:hypothetical protein
MEIELVAQSVPNQIVVVRHWRFHAGEAVLACLTLASMGGAALVM